VKAPYPLGSSVAIDLDTQVLAGGSLYGGSPRRILRLSSAGKSAWSELVAGRVSSQAGARLARQLTDAGMLHPVCSPAAGRDVIVVIPVRDRASELDRCLAALGSDHRVLVVDDASIDPSRVAAVCAAHAAQLVPLAANGGPAAARMAALAHLEADLVLFLDSDTVPPRDLVDRLAGHFDDPVVAAVAPRITALQGASSASRYGMAAGSLDLGDQAARVMTGGRVSYVPTAALLVRRSALDAVGGFDAGLRFGEDVDLVWRLDAAGWRVRYEPSVRVQHAEPTRWLPLLRRRYLYGTSAGPLARRHPGTLTPLVVHSWSGVAVLGLLARRPSLVAAGLTGSTLSLRHRLNAVDAPTDGAALEAAKAAGQSWQQAGRAATQLGAPLLTAAAIRGGRGSRVVLAALVLTAPVIEWCSGPRTLDPARFVLARIADDLAYGCGVIAGSIKARTVEPLKPRITGRLLRIAPPAPSALHAVPSAPGPIVAVAAQPSRKRSVHA
jgi:mycofactocin system glycosyltransferase